MFSAAPAETAGGRVEPDGPGGIRLLAPAGEAAPAYTLAVQLDGIVRTGLLREPSIGQKFRYGRN
jgi:hypothetical protein